MQKLLSEVDGRRKPKALGPECEQCENKKQQMKMAVNSSPGWRIPRTLLSADATTFFVSLSAVEDPICSQAMQRRPKIAAVPSASGCISRNRKHAARALSFASRTIRRQRTPQCRRADTLLLLNFRSPAIRKSRNLGSDPVETALDHDLAHHLACPEQSVLDRSKRQVCHFGYLVVAEIACVPQQNELLVRIRKPFDDLPDLCPPLADLTILFGRAARGFDL